MENKIFSYSLTIKENHLDTFGHVNNASYLIMLEEARWEFLTQNNYGLKKIQEIGLGPIILEIKLVFLKEIRLREKIYIDTQIVSYEKKIGKLIQKIIRNGEICCEAEILMGLFDLTKRKLIMPTVEWLHVIGCNKGASSNTL